MRDEHDGLGRRGDLEDPGLALGAEGLVAGRKDLVQQQHVRVNRGRDGEAQPGPHPGGVRLDRSIDELAEVGEFDDPGQPARHVLWFYAEKRSGEDDVLAPVQFLGEPRTERQKA